MITFTSLTTTLNRTILTNNIGSKYCKFLSFLLQGALLLSLGILLISCATATMPQQTYLTNTSLSGISKVAIVVTVSAPTVSHSLPAQEYMGSNPPPIFVLFALLGATVRSGVDAKNAGTIRDRMDFQQLEEKTVHAFIQPLKKGNCFHVAEYITDKKPDNHQLSAAGYDAIIRLSLKEISLKRTAGEKVNLYLTIHGQMESLASGMILWDREELVSSSESRSLDYYKENGLKELDAMLEKAGKYLAYDFVYLK